MENPNEASGSMSSYHYVEYNQESPHPKFTPIQIDYIRSIDRILMQEEVEAVSKAESFRIRLEDGIVRCREVPGLRLNYGNTVVYIQRYSDERFAEFMEKVMDHIAGEPQGPKMFLRFVDPIRILLQDVGIFYPLTYGVGASRWRDKVRSKIEELGALTGEFDNGKFVLSDGRTFSVAALRIERSSNPGPGYVADW